MTKLPTKKLTHDAIQTSVRLPKALHSELQAGAEHRAHSLNAEILRRLQLDQYQTVMAELAEVKAMLRQVLDMT